MGCFQTQSLLLENLKYSYFLSHQPFVTELRDISAAFLGGSKVILSQEQNALSEMAEQL